jgi:hypothetical protein
LDAFIITHFDIDHIRGAATLVEWFIEKRGGLGGIYVTGSLLLRAAVEGRKQAIRRKKVRSEYDKFVNAILRFCPDRGTQTKIRPQLADDPPLEFLKSRSGDWSLVSIYPFRTQEPASITDAAAATTTFRLQRVDQNDLSAALIVCNRGLEFPLLLLGGDVPGDPAWHKAMKFWQNKIKSYHGAEWNWLPTDAGPAWIKVPHHGSWIRGYSSAIFDGRQPGVPRHAFVSSANDYGRALPDKRVLEAYIANGYSVWNTGLLPVSKDPYDAKPWSLAVLSRLSSSESATQPDCIEVTWPVNSPIPLGSEVRLADLGKYAEAKSG